MAKRAKRAASDLELRDTVASAIKSPKAVLVPHVYPRSELAVEISKTYDEITSRAPQENHEPSPEAVKLKGKMALVRQAVIALGSQLTGGAVAVTKTRNNLVRNWLKQKGLPPISDRHLFRYFKEYPI